MFGGEFGAFRSKYRHFFNEDNEIYGNLSEILQIRKGNIALRRGRQYLREISGDGYNFGYPSMLGGEMRSIVPWSRIFNNREVLLAINTDYNNPQTAWVTLDNSLNSPGSRLSCTFSTDRQMMGSQLTVEERNGKSVQMTVPAGGFVIYEQV
jgi:hypothetical protein